MALVLDGMPAEEKRRRFAGMVSQLVAERLAILRGEDGDHIEDGIDNHTGLQIPSSGIGQGVSDSYLVIGAMIKEIGAEAYLGVASRSRTDLIGCNSCWRGFDHSAAVFGRTPTRYSYCLVTCSTRPTMT